jgi:predicted transcriptional regulator
MPALHPIKRKGTARELAEKWGVTPQTVRRYIAQPRAEFEANSITRAQPWKALGVSRTTWYRRGKPEEWQLYARVSGVLGVSGA